MTEEYVISGECAGAENTVLLYFAYDF